MIVAVVALAGFVGGFIFAAIRTAALVRRALIAVLQAAHPRWLSTLELKEVFGGGVYGALRDLDADGVILGKEELGGSERGGMLYRWP